MVAEELLMTRRSPPSNTDPPKTSNKSKPIIDTPCMFGDAESDVPNNRTIQLDIERYTPYIDREYCFRCTYIKVLFAVEVEV